MKFNPFLLILTFLFSCNSSRDYYKRGDYYLAVFKSVDRLKQSPMHSKSREVLQKAYPLALRTLESKSQNLIASYDPFKYRKTLLLYSQIDSMYELIYSSPAALEVVPEPKNYYKEIGELRHSVADETYEAGIQSMMKGTRTDSRTAYRYFSETNALVPQYKEVVEMLGKSEEKATLLVVWDIGQPKWWGTTAITSAIDALPFVELQPWRTYVYSDDPNKKDVDLKLTISSLDYSEGTITSTSSSREVIDSVTVGQKKVKGVIVPTKQAIKGTYIEHNEKVKAKGTVYVTIRDTKSGVIFFTREFIGYGEWTGSWCECVGDKKVFGFSYRCDSRPPAPDSGLLRKQIEDQILATSIETLKNLLAEY